VRDSDRILGLCSCSYQTVVSKAVAKLSAWHEHARGNVGAASCVLSSHYWTE